MASLRSTVAGAWRRTPAGRRTDEDRRLDAEQRAALAQLHKDAQRLVDSGVVDVEWCSVLAGSRFRTPFEAAVEYLETGRAEGRSVHPLLEPSYLEPDRWRDKKVDPALDYVRGRHNRAPHPLFDEDAYRASHPGCEQELGSSLGHFLRAADDGSLIPAPPGAPLPDLALGPWRERVLAAARAQASRPRRERRGRREPRVDGRVSVVVATHEDWRGAVAAVRSVVSTTSGSDVEVVLVDTGSSRAVVTMLAGLLDGLPGVSLRVRRDLLDDADALQDGFDASTGSLVLLVPGAAVVRDGWLDPLLAVMADDTVLGAQPLLLAPDGTVRSAGQWFPAADVLPVPFLEHHPPEDARALGTIPVNAVTGAVLVRAEQVREAGGLDDALTGTLAVADLCLHLGVGGRQPAFRVVTSSVVEVADAPAEPIEAAAEAERAARERFLARWSGVMPSDGDRLWQGTGFVLEGTAPVDDGLVPAVPRAVVSRPRVVTGEGVPRLRWAIKNPAFTGPRGDRWGDTFFASDLAAALRRLGQEVVVDRRDAFDRPTSGLDDVTLTLRGRVAWSPPSDGVHLLWVISHPEEVTAEEVRRFDRAFAASEPWAARASEEAGVPVEVLHQATDPSRFSPDLRHDGDRPVLFVGNSRGVERRVLRDAAEAGLDVAVWGKGWEGRLPDGWLRADHLPNAELGAAYASAGVVLCDHWADMAAEGFLSNRLFDAAASGARVVSDPVPGADTVFGPLVRTYADPDDLRRLVTDLEGSFPSDDERAALGREIGVRHSFDARARRLLDVALELRASGA